MTLRTVHVYLSHGFSNYTYWTIFSHSMHTRMAPYILIKKNELRMFYFRPLWYKDLWLDRVFLLLNTFWQNLHTNVSEELSCISVIWTCQLHLVAKTFPQYWQENPKIKRELLMGIFYFSNILSFIKTCLHTLNLNIKMTIGHTN